MEGEPHISENECNELGLKLGDVVKFKEEFPDEVGARFFLLEDPTNTPRVNIQLICDMTYPPVLRVELKDIEKVNDEDVPFADGIPKIDGLTD